MFDTLRIKAKLALAPLIYRNPPIGLQPSELGIFLTELLARSAVPGDVAEVGCSVGGTACLASAIVRRFAPKKSYTCFDTFDGFVADQFEADIRLGTPRAAGKAFNANSVELVRRILDLHGGKSVRLVKGDIAEIPENQLSSAYSVVLLDVDLAEPTHAALKRFWPRLSAGGIILVDDCLDCPEQRWFARIGFERFCAEEGLEPRMRYGFGFLEKPSIENHRRVA
jgi:predicted O-methyltransferase YrrM